MIAAVVKQWGSLELTDAAEPTPEAGEVIVDLRAAALNRRDLNVLEGRHPDCLLPLIPGSDGAGVRRDTGEPVVILPALAWGDDETQPSRAFRILGGPDNGTHAAAVSVPEENLYPKPSALSWNAAAALPLAGLTAYRALFSRAGLKAGETVLILGAGSGVSTVAIVLASHAGARVLVTSSSRAKIERAEALGAEGGVLYPDRDWALAVRRLSDGGVDVVFDSVGVTLPDSIRSLRTGGRCVVFGATAGPNVTLNVRKLFWGQQSLLGSTMGSPRDFEGMLTMANAPALEDVVDSVFPLVEVEAAYERQRSGEHMGKIVLAIAAPPS